MTESRREESIEDNNVQTVTESVGEKAVCAKNLLWLLAVWIGYMYSHWRFGSLGIWTSYALGFNTSSRSLQKTKEQCCRMKNTGEFRYHLLWRWFKWYGKLCRRASESKICIFQSAANWLRQVQCLSFPTQLLPTSYSECAERGQTDHFETTNRWTVHFFDWYKKI